MLVNATNMLLKAYAMATMPSVSSTLTTWNGPRAFCSLHRK